MTFLGLMPGERAAARGWGFAVSALSVPRSGVEFCHFVRVMFLVEVFGSMVGTPRFLTELQLFYTSFLTCRLL